MELVYSENITELICRSVAAFECCTFPNRVRHKIAIMRPTSSRPYTFHYPMRIFMDEEYSVIGRADVMVRLQPALNHNSCSVSDAGIKVEREWCKNEK